MDILTKEDKMEIIEGRVKILLYDLSDITEKLRDWRSSDPKAINRVLLLARLDRVSTELLDLIAPYLSVPNTAPRV